jgi:N-acetyl-anhydromuramyl-L-alanine amidase AmpD
MNTSSNNKNELKSIDSNSTSDPKNTKKVLKTSNELTVDIVNTLPVHATKLPKKQTTIKKLVVHTTDGVVTPKGLAKYDIGPNHISSTGCPTITYHYLIKQSGEAFKTADLENVLWHAGNHNPESIAIALIYKQDHDWEELAVKKEALHDPGPDNRPSEEAYTKLVDLLTALCIEHDLNEHDIYGHRELSGTGTIIVNGGLVFRKTCPGMSVNLDLLRSQVKDQLSSIT